MFPRLFENPKRLDAFIAALLLLYTSRRNSVRFFLAAHFFKDFKIKVLIFLLLNDSKCYIDKTNITMFHEQVILAILLISF